MIDVATLIVIRRWALREPLSIREIACRTGLLRNTIRKYLRAGEAEPRYSSGGIETYSSPGWHVCMSAFCLRSKASLS